MPQTDLDKFFDSLDSDNDDVDDELANALADQAKDEANDNKTGVDDGDDQQNDDSGKDDSDNKEMSLEEKLALIEKENKGLRKDIVKIRGDRREARDRFNRLHGMIEQIQKEKAGSQSDEKAGDKKSDDPLKDLKLAVEYDDDGNPYVPADALAEIIKGHDQKLEETKRAYLQDKAAQEQMQTVQNTIQKIVSMDDQYPNAYRSVERALADMNQRVMEIQQEREMTGALTPGQALDLLEQEGALGEWQKQYPGMDPDIVANAFQSERQLKKALDVVAKFSTNNNNDDKIDDTNKAKKSLSDAAIQDKLSKKPSTHGKGATDARDSIVDKVGSSRSEDILNLSDKDVERLMEKMRQEELSSY